MSALDDQLLKELVTAGKVTTEQAAEILKEQGASGGDLGRILIARGVVSEEDHAKRRARALKIPYVDVESLQPDPEIITLLPEKLCIRVTAVVLDRRDGELMVAMENPGDLISVDELGRECRLRIQPVLGSRSAISDSC